MSFDHGTYMKTENNIYIYIPIYINVCTWVYIYIETYRWVKPFVNLTRTHTPIFSRAWSNRHGALVTRFSQVLMTKPAGVVLMQVLVFPGSWLDMTGWVDHPIKSWFRKNTFNRCILQKSNRSPTVGNQVIYLSNEGYFFLWSEINDSDCPTRLSFTYGYGESAGWCELYRWFFIDPFHLRMTQKWHLKHEKRLWKAALGFMFMKAYDSHGWGYTPTNIKMAPHCADWTLKHRKKTIESAT